MRKFRKKFRKEKTFKSNFPHLSDKPVDYVNSEKFENMANKLEKRIEKLARKKPDPQNADVLDHYIVDVTSEELQRLIDQQIEHHATISGMEAQAISARKRLPKKQKDIEEKLQKIQSEITKITEKRDKNRYVVKGDL